MTARNGNEWIRRTGLENSQRIRRIVQIAFLLLNLWIGVAFLLFVLSMEGRIGFAATRPAGIDGWLPIAGMMNTRYFFLTGRVATVHPAAMFLFLTFVALSLLLRKAFCGWLCPAGTI